MALTSDATGSGTSLPVSELSLDKVDLRNLRLANSVIKHNGINAIYNNSESVRLIHKTSVERFNDSGEIVLNNNEITFKVIDIPNPKYGDTIETDFIALTLKSPIKTTVGLSTWLAV